MEKVRMTNARDKGRYAATDPNLMQLAVVTLTNAQIKALRATPKELVAAPGAGKMLVLAQGLIKLDVGTEVLAESTANLGVKYNNGSGVQVSTTVECTGFIDQAADTYTSIVPKADAIVAASGAENKALVLHNLGAGEFSGNATADATMTVYIWYRTLTL